MNSWCAQTGGAAGKERGRDGGRDRGRGNLKCWAPAVNSSCFCFRVINVPLNRARAWAPVSAAFNAISSPDWTGLGAAGGGLYFLPSPVNEVMRAWGLEAGHSRGGLTRAPQAPMACSPETPPESHSHFPTLPYLLILLPRQGILTLPPQRPLACSPLPPRAPLMSELDTFPLHSQTSPSPRPLTEQSFIKLFHALSGRGAPGDGGLFRPFVGAPQDRPA